MGIAGLDMLSHFLYKRKPLRYYKAPDKDCAERAVEVPIALDYLKTKTDAPILEVGNVLFHYPELLKPYPHLHTRTTIDKFEQCPGVENIDLMDYNIKHDFIVSISTVEHVGQWFGEIKIGDREAPLRAIQKIYNLLKPGGQAIITVPFGRLMDLDWLIQFSSEYLAMLSSQFGVPKEAITTSFMKKLDMEATFDSPLQAWIQCEEAEVEEAYYFHPFVFANGVAIIELVKIGEDVTMLPPAPNTSLRYHPPVEIGEIYFKPFYKPQGSDRNGFITAHASDYLVLGHPIPVPAQVYRLELLIEVYGTGSFTIDLFSANRNIVYWTRDFTQTAFMQDLLYMVIPEEKLQLRLHKKQASECYVRIPRALFAQL